MKYLEIAKLCSFLHGEVITEKFDREGFNPDSKESRDSLKRVQDYQVEYALIEMHENFTTHWDSERMIEQLKKDYEVYLTDLQNLIRYGTTKTGEIKNKFFKIQACLKNPTFLEPFLIYFLMSQEEGEEQNKEYAFNSIWFKVGLKFATGEITMKSLQDKSAPKIRKELKLPNSADVYIKATINNYAGNGNSDKNIYLNLNKMETITEYCRFNRISIADEFLERLRFLRDSDN